MTRSRHLPPSSEPPTDGPFEADLEEQHQFWRVMAGKEVVAVITSGRPRADAERIAAVLTEVHGVPNDQIAEGIIVRLFVTARNLVDLLEEVELPITDLAAHRAHTILQANRDLEVVGLKRRSA